MKMKAGNIFWVGICLMEMVFSQESQYLYLMAEGNNLFDTGQWEEATLHYEKAIRIEPLKADAHLQLGHIHLQKGYPNAALRYFRKAEKNKDRFLIPETELELYLNMCFAFHQIKKPRKETTYLHRILSIATNESHGFYQTYAGRAFFLFGLLYLGQKKRMEAKDAFLRSLVYRYREKTCYLYAAHYYASTSQEEIDGDVADYYDDKRTREDRKRFFIFYYSKYNTTQLSQEERKNFEENLSSYVQAVERYWREINRPE